jgi:acetylornithine deacetylase
LHFPSLKIGPGSSSRSHTADEFIKIEEINKAIEIYVELLDGMTFDIFSE